MSPQLSVGSSHAREPGAYRAFPQKQLRGPEVGHSEQGPEWHTSAHECRPHASFFPHTPSQRHSRSLHARTATARRHAHGMGMRSSHGGHAPSWHGNRHEWKHAARVAAAAAVVASPARAAPFLPQGSPHEARG